MNNWDDYRLILAIHRGKTLRNAAQQLNINHTTVARRLVSLNQRLGAAVAEPTSAGYALTTLGESLLSSAEQIEALAINDQRLHRTGQIDLTGNIRLSLPPAILQFLLLDELREFQMQHPNINLNIETSYQLANLDTCEADVVIRVSNEPSEHLVGHRLFPVAVNYFADKQYLDNTDTEHYQWITATYDDEQPAWIAHSPFPEAKVGLRIDDLVLRHQASAQGHGLVLGACYIAESFDNLRPVADSAPFPYQDIWVLTHPDFIKIPRIKTLMSYLTDTLRMKKGLIIGGAL